MSTPASRPDLPGVTESVYQPIVDLGTGALAGFEALTRPPTGSAWTSPEEMFIEAERRNSTIDFDWQCRVSALQGALVAGFPHELALFVNAEPAALDAPPPSYAIPVLAAAKSLSIVIEITERRLMKDPAGLLRAVSHARDMGCRIAIDDVGGDSSSLALLSLLRPDVIKLDMHLVHRRTTASTEILSAVTAESERTGAVVVAEGIENDVHQRWALDVGARWGQGWLFGAPAPLPSLDTVPRVANRGLGWPAVTVRAPVAVTPYGLTNGHSAALRIDEAQLETLEDDLLERAASIGSTALILMTVPSSTAVAGSRCEMFAMLTAVSALTAVFRPRPLAQVDIGCRVVEVGPDEPLASERTVIIVDPSFNAALTALDRGYAADGSRCFDYRLSFDRDRVLDAATLLLQRIPALV